MVIEAMAPESGINHCRIEGEPHFRALDLACTIYAHPKQRGLANAAIRVFVDANHPPEHMVHKGGAKGRYFPIAEMGPLTRSLCDPANDELARARFFGALKARERERMAAAAAAVLPIPAAAIAPPPVIAAEPPKELTPPMTPIEIHDILLPLRQMRVSDHPWLRFAAIEGRLYWAWGDFANAVCLQSGKNPLCSSQYKRGMALAEGDTIRLNGGDKGNPLMLVDARLDDAFKVLSTRPDYDRELSGRVQRRMRQLADQIGPSLTDKALEALQVAETQPDVIDEAEATLRAAEDTPAPAIESIKDAIAAQMSGGEPGFMLPLAPEAIAAVEAASKAPVPFPTEATAGIEVLRTITFDPKRKADQLLESVAMMAAEIKASTAQTQGMRETIERLGSSLEDAVEALRLAQAGIERRDEQIASLERLIALAGQHLTAAVRHHS